ncbi:MAG: hypothetical protein JWQ83_2076 [Lacunisphaera sp.]|nr:hypothetical protein [Lacunisphaera sp.]
MALRAPGITAEGRLIRQLEQVLAHRMTGILLRLFGAAQNAMQDFLPVVHWFCTAQAVSKQLSLRKALGEFSGDKRCRSGSARTSGWVRALTLKDWARH